MDFARGIRVSLCRWLMNGAGQRLSRHPVVSATFRTLPDGRSALHCDGRKFMLSLLGASVRGSLAGSSSLPAEVM